jgi:hypothetical protein
VVVVILIVLIDGAILVGCELSPGASFYPGNRVVCVVILIVNLKDGGERLDWRV